MECIIDGELHATEVFEFLYDNYDPDPERKQIFVFEGSSGSSKTTSIIQFLTGIYAQNNKGKKITAGRSRMTWTIDSIWDDFIKHLSDNRYKFNQHKTKHTVELFKNRFRFVGADDPQKFHGPRQDVAWFNEAMELDSNSFDQLNMRTNELIILDYNPSSTVHWIYDKLTNNTKPHGDGFHKVMRFNMPDGRTIEVDVFYHKSTFEKNAFLPDGQRAAILSYDPSNPINVENGTADEYKHKVYALGERAQREGVIIKRWKRGAFNYDLPINFGLDFGFEHPLALVQVAVDFEHKIIYAKELIHEAGLTPTNFFRRFEAIMHPDDHVEADPGNGLDKINELITLGYDVAVAEKPPGSVYQALTEFQDFMFIFDNSPKLENEANNYIWHEKIKDTPRKLFDDGFDAIRYVYWAITRG